MSESKEIKALRILRLQGLEAAFANTIANLERAMKTLGLKDEDVVILRDIVEAFAAPEGVAEFQEIFSPAYTSRFTEEELDQLILLFNTPIYQKFVAAQPSIAEENIDKAMSWLQGKILPVLEKYGMDPSVPPQEPQDPDFDLDYPYPESDDDWSPDSDDDDWNG